MVTALKTNLTVGTILSNPELFDKVRRLADMEFNKVYTELVFGLDEAIPVGKAMADNGADVIIGRNCVAELLRGNLKIPVIPIKMNPHPGRRCKTWRSWKSSSKSGSSRGSITTRRVSSGWLPRQKTRGPRSSSEAASPSNTQKV